jgi:hypothetical protein
MTPAISGVIEFDQKTDILKVLSRYDQQRKEALWPGNSPHFALHLRGLSIQT